MSEQNKRTYTLEFKKEAVRLVTEQGYTLCWSKVFTSDQQEQSKKPHDQVGENIRSCGINQNPGYLLPGNGTPRSPGGFPLPWRGCTPSYDGEAVLPQHWALNIKSCCRVCLA